VRDEIGDEAMEQLFRVLDVIAEGEPVLPEDRSGTTRAAQRLQWRQEEDPGPA